MLLATRYKQNNTKSIVKGMCITIIKDRIIREIPYSKNVKEIK